MTEDLKNTQLASPGMKLCVYSESILHQGSENMRMIRPQTFAKKFLAINLR